MASTDLSPRDFHLTSNSSSIPLSRSNPPNVRPPRSSGSSTGRAKTEQVVLEFLYKVAELIVQSRVNLQAEPDLRRGNRRSRFNLDIEEIQMVRDAMMTWKEDVRRPLAIDIYWDGSGDADGKVLLERWSVTFAAEGESSSAQLGSTQDVIQQLKEVCKRISILLRALFSFMRQLPAHRLFTQSYPSMLSYTMQVASVADASRFFEAQRVATSGYAFLPIMTPFGQLQVAAVYRRDCDQFTEREEKTVPSSIFQDDFIIQDYVPASPELTSASAPHSSQLRTIVTLSPTTETDLRSNSFVPVSIAGETFCEDGEEVLQWQRSSPRSIPTPHQPFSLADVHDNRTTKERLMGRIQPGMSKPMAIPRISSKGGIATTGTRDVETSMAYRENTEGKLIQHAHSYESEHDVRLRGAAANPNVTAAPYGYGNVAIEREQEHNLSPSLAFQQRQQRLWEGLNNHQNDAESGLYVSQTSIQDEPSSIRNTAYHPISTPPRHPKSQLYQQDPRRRKISFNGAFVSEIAHSQSPTSNSSVTGKADTNPMPPQDAPTGHMAMFSVSPPFQVNPCELLSTSPAYSFSKNRIQSGSSNVPTFATTDQFQLRLHSSTTSSTTLISAQKRGFSPDFGDSGVTTWGVSPDTPDSFGLALLGASDTVSGGRLRGSLAESAEAGETSDTQANDSSSDGLDMLLPFAIEDCSTTATAALDTHSTGSLTCSSRLETASVGEFLLQIKNAPRLSSSVSHAFTKTTDESSENSSKDSSQKIHLQTSLLEDELAGFRSLRDELAQGI